MMNILALDISVNSTGYAIISYPDLRLVDYGSIIYDKELIKTSSSTSYHIKTRKQLDFIKALIEKYNITQSYIERFSFGSFGNSNAVTIISEVTGCIKFLLYELGVSYEAISPQTVKKQICGNGRSTKKEVYDKILLSYPEIIGCKDDTSDAIGVGLVGIQLSPP